MTVAENTHAPAASTDELIDRLRPRFLAELRERQLGLIAARDSLKQGIASAESISTIRRIAHKLRGTAETFHYGDIASAAAALEDAATAPTSSDSADVIRLANALLKACRKAPRGAEAPPAASTSAAAIETLPVAATPPRVLVVEDQEPTQLMIRKLLSDSATVICVDDVSSAKQSIDAATPDLIILDYHLADGASGFDLIDILRDDARERDIPVIMLTASSEPDVIMRAMVAGAVDYIVKPIDPETFKLKVREFLSARQSTVLIADDDKTVRDILTYKFHARGIRTIEAASGAEALRQLKETIPDLIVLDRIMPGFDGITVLKRMRDDPSLREIPVLILSARRNESDILEGLKLGAADYIAKPFNADIVIQRAIRLVAQRKKSEK